MTLYHTAYQKSSYEFKLKYYFSVPDYSTAHISGKTTPAIQIFNTINMGNVDNSYNIDNITTNIDNKHVKNVTINQYVANFFTSVQQIEQGLNHQLEPKQKEILHAHVQKAQKATTLAGSGDATLLETLPNLNKILKSVCMIRWEEYDPKIGQLCEYTGTGFLAKTQKDDGTVDGVVFVSAGHNFDMILNSSARADSLRGFTVQFGNVSGTIPSNNITSMNDSLWKPGMPMNLAEFLDPHKVSGSISYQGRKVLFKGGNLTEYVSGDVKAVEDYCVLKLEGNLVDIEKYLDKLELDCLMCGHSEYLECNDGGLVAIFGHPGDEVEENGKRPMRMCFGVEKDPDTTKGFYAESNPMWKLIGPKYDVKKQWKGEYPNNTEIKNYLFYDNDTFPGNSGSPVIGRGNHGQGYVVKGIHIRSFNPASTNGAQKIVKLNDWIHLSAQIQNPVSSSQKADSHRKKESAVSALPQVRHGKSVDSSKARTDPSQPPPGTKITKLIYDQCAPFRK